MARRVTRLSKDRDNSHSICHKRIIQEFNMLKKPVPGICLVADEKDITIVHALIAGPPQTPYRGGFFYFRIHCPPNYPFRPPTVKLMTTDGGRVRFNPNIDANGQVFLSILGTQKKGPRWISSLNLTEVLKSIQFLMMKRCTETEGDALHQVIQHETLRVGVVGMVEEPPEGCPQDLRTAMQQKFLDRYEDYVSTCQSAVSLDGSTMQHPFDDANQVKFDHVSILKRLRKLKEKLDGVGEIR